MSAAPDVVRQIIATPDGNGVPTANWKLTEASIIDSVKIQIRPTVLPVIFVPGIMGSNLRKKEDKQSVWRLDVTPVVGEPVGLIWKMSGKLAGKRQLLLNPATTEVDPDGSVPSAIPTTGGNVEEQLRARGWGEVGESSYKKLLVWLETELNPADLNAAKWPGYQLGEAVLTAPTKPGDKPKLYPHTKMHMEGEPANLRPDQALMSDDLLKRSKCWMPVHACGYNWLASNKEAATRLADKINTLIDQYNKGIYSCSQVVLVTHSMGGLVARACAQLPGMADKIAGIVHGVMPAVGAAVAYRRCKVGMWDEGEISGFAADRKNQIASGVIGKTGQEVTAVFAQAPGALQLLPTNDYTAHGRKEWLVLADTNNILDRWPKKNPYDDIYLERNKWWGLINEAWLAPEGGTGLTWNLYADNLGEARHFHTALSGKYHPNTYVLYGDDKKQHSFEALVWHIKKGQFKPKQPRNLTPQQVTELNQTDVRTDGSNAGYVGGEHVTFRDMNSKERHYDTSDWELQCLQQDSAGDGTVPLSSGCAPEQQSPGDIKLQRGLTGFAHEPAYQNAAMQRHTLFCINKIVGQAKLPA